MKHCVALKLKANNNIIMVIESLLAKLCGVGYFL